MSDIIQKTNEYYLELGRFVSKFSEMERLLKVLCWQITGVSKEVAEYFFTNQSADKSIETIKNFLSAHDGDKSAQLLKVIHHLKVISSKRNKIVHHGVNFSESGIMINSPLGNYKENHEISVNDLCNMWRDLNTMQGLFMAFFLQFRLGVKGNNLDSALSGFIPGFGEGALPPWRYKPHQHQSPKN